MNKATGSATAIQMVGLQNKFEGAPNANIRAVKNDFTTTTNKNQYGLENTFNSTGAAASRVGLNNTFNNGGGVSMGVQNVFPISNQVTGTLRGVFNNILTPAAGVHYGTQNILKGGSDANKYGTHSDLGGTGNGKHYGSYQTLEGTGTGSKYGMYSKVYAAAQGVHYGIYAEATKANSYAGYFKGRLSLGATSINRYLMPDEDGTANQVLTTDGNGTTSWQTPETLHLTPALSKIVLSQAQVIPTSGYHKLAFITPEFDTQENFRSTDNTYAASQNGYYRIQISFKGQAINNLPTNIQLALFKNDQIIEERFIENSMLISGALETVIILNTGDHLEVFISSSNQITLNNAPHQTSFKIEQM
jgi:hypothetical protein